MTQVRRYLALLGAVGLLTGCGNAYQHLTIGKWREVGQPAQPVAPQTASFVVTTIDPGEGPPVQAGDLVKARVKVSIVSKAGGDSRYKDSMPPQVVWVWTGSEPQDIGTYGTTGGPEAHAIFIGRQLHQQFELDGASEFWSADLPVNVFIDYRFSRMLHGASINGRDFEPPEWPGLPLEDNAVTKTSARIEILEICRDAKLYRRTAVLTQYGKMGPTIGDGPEYQSKRQGTLGWSALEAHCPDGPIRFQAGPFYNFDLHDEAHLSDWGGSYAVLRPPEQHPQEWCVAGVHSPSPSGLQPQSGGQPRPCTTFPEWIQLHNDYR